ncbi:MAG: sigma-70 family RNA polymerase sigma factor [Muribaculaceae bacterium]|nr:sigma-70 family RNA polymerase sigma factor [Muribaculaceae bacterium]
MNSNKTSDIDIFEGIVSHNQDRLFRFAFMRVGVREVAEDIVQDVLLRLFRAMSEGKEIKKPEYFLLRSVSNACIDYTRRKKPAPIQLEDVVEIQEDEADEDITEEFNRINQLLDGLPPNQAETVRLRCYDELPFREIAELQGISEATVKSRYKRAIWYIKEKLNLNKRHD